MSNTRTRKSTRAARAHCNRKDTIIGILRLEGGISQERAENAFRISNKKTKINHRSSRAKNKRNPPRCGEQDPSEAEGTEKNGRNARRRSTKSLSRSPSLSEEELDESGNADEDEDEDDPSPVGMMKWTRMKTIEEEQQAAMGCTYLLIPGLYLYY